MRNRLGLGRFELFVALRYLKAKRKQAVVSVITVISVAGVAAGVMALVVALAINNGFRTVLQKTLLGATAHVTVLEKEPLYGIDDWEGLVAKLVRLPHVISAEPVLYGAVFLSSPLQSEGAEIKGIEVGPGHRVNDLLRHLKEGSIERLENASGFPGIILGSKLSVRTGLTLNSVATVISPQGELTPFGPKPSYFRFRVVGIFETGFYDLDSQWALTTLQAAQKVLSLRDVVNAIEIKLDDIHQAPQVSRLASRIVGPKLVVTNWMELNRPLFQALKMEKRVTVVTIGLIVLIAAMNILVALVMMVMEKYRDIAILVSMGAKREQIRRIFVLQGLMIGTLGSVIGLVAGYSLCYFAERYRWVRLDEQIYALSYVPFNARWNDGVWIAAAAIFISYLATLYPARNATAIAPAEALRYE
jgi:lipoprotein-releasing system permease protein